MRKLFGTDGIRGKANVDPMTPEMVLRVGKALSKYLQRKSQGKKIKIVVGKDTRLSGYMFEAALEAGIVAMGADCHLVGPMPTPAIAHLTKSLKADAGIMLSASHNQAGDNGIKIFDSQGFKLSDAAEEEIESLILAEKVEGNGAGIGKAYRIDDARGRYIEFTKASIRNHSLEGLKVVLDCAHGAAYSLAPSIFAEMGAKVITLNDKPNGHNINKDCGALYPEVIQEKVKAEKADIGIALDGDADRVIVCDERGELFDGDHLLAACAIYFKEKGLLKNDTVVTTVMANIGFDLAMQKAGINVIKTKVGDRYVIEEMRNGGHILGGEQSGHIIFSRYASTGDGIIAALQLMDGMKKQGKRLSELSRLMETYPQILININVKEKKPFEEMPAVKQAMAEAETRLGENGRILVRYSGTEKKARVMVEGQSQNEINSLAENIADKILEEIGAE
jgi:phosphoglucosamine mutase